jgi:hypothetical protein
MTDNIVNLDDHRPHVAAYVACIHCGKDWIAVAPADTLHFECPACAKLSGVVVDPSSPEFINDLHAARQDQSRPPQAHDGGAERAAHDRRGGVPMTEVQAAATRRLRRKLEILKLDATRTRGQLFHDIHECLALVDIIDKSEDAQ